MSEQNNHDHQERALSDTISELIVNGPLEAAIDYVDDDVSQQATAVRNAMNMQREAVKYGRESGFEPHAAKAAGMALENANVQLEQSSRRLTQARNAARKRLFSSE
jgi:hypothetical protein